MSLVHKDRILAELKKYSAKFGKFTLSSGKESDFYIDCKKSYTPTILAKISYSFRELIWQNKLSRAVGCGGLTMGADPLAVALAMAGNGLWPFYVRKEPKKHGTLSWMEGPDFEPGADLLILEDVITTGASAIKAIERVREHGLNPIAVLALVDRQEENGKKNIEAQGIPVYSILEKQDFR